MDVVLTTDNTGFEPRDVTPEATEEINGRSVPEIPELLRLEGLRIIKRLVLSRKVTLIRKNTYIINLPDEPKAVEQSLKVLLDLMPHAVDMLKDK